MFALSLIVRVNRVISVMFALPLIIREKYSNISYVCLFSYC